MAKSRNDILFRFLGDTKSLDRASGKAKAGFRKTQSAAGSLKTAVAGLGVALGVRGLVRHIGSAINRAEEMDSKYAITAKILEDTGGAANVTAGEVKKMAEEMAMTTGIDKAILTDAANVMLTFAEVANVAGDMNDVFDRSVALTADMATVFGGSASDAAKQLGKALNDPILGVTALSRTGVQFTTQQKEQIKIMQESGDILGAQKLILKELDEQVGGTAEASADATAIMARGFDEVAESIGEELLPQIVAITPAIVDMSKKSVKAIGNLSLGMQILTKAVSGPLTSAWTDADQALLDFTRTQEDSIRKMDEGMGSALVLAQWMIYLADAGSLTDTNMDRMQETLGVSNEQMAEGAVLAGTYAGQLDADAAAADIATKAFEDWYGITADQVVLMSDSMKLYGEYRDGILGIKDAAIKAAGAIRDIPTLSDVEDVVNERGTGGGGGGDKMQSFPGITVNFNGVVGDPVAVAQQISDLLEVNGMGP